MDPEVDEAAAIEEPRQIALPGFEGVQPTAATLGFVGSVALPSSAEPVGPDEIAYYLVEAVAEGIGHKKMARSGWTRRQVLTVSRVLKVGRDDALEAFGDDDASVIDFAHRNDDLGDEMSLDGGAE
jgi:hypothetical protein